MHEGVRMLEWPYLLEPIEVDERLKPDHHQLERNQLDEPEEELLVAARHEAGAGDVGHYEEFDAQLAIQSCHRCFPRRAESAEQLAQALWQAVPAEEEVPNVDREHAEFQESEEGVFVVHFLRDEAPPERDLVGCSDLLTLQIAREEL